MLSISLVLTVINLPLHQPTTYLAATKITKKRISSNW